MVIVKILGLIDILSAFLFLMMIFGMEVFIWLVIFCAFLLLIKGMFIFSGEMLSLIDLSAGLLLFLSIIFQPFTFLIWIASLLLVAKGFVSLL